MIAEIDRAREAGDTMGGSFEVIARGVPVGLGSYVQWDRKLDGRLAQALMSIPAIKAVGIGRGPAWPRCRARAFTTRSCRAGGAAPHPTCRVSRPTNNAGGLEGGVTNGEDLRVSGYMKPIATLMKPLRSVDLTTMAEQPGRHRAQRRLRRAGRGGRRRSDGRASSSRTPSLEKFGGDSIDEARRQPGARYRARTEPRAFRARADDVDRSSAHDPTHSQIRRRRAARPAAARRRDHPGDRRLIDDMIETMYAAPGIGLAAPQVGVPLRIFVDRHLSVGRDPTA